MAEPCNENRNTTRTDREQPQRPQRETTGGEISRQPSSGAVSRYRDPFSMLTDLHREMDRIFQNAGFGGGLLSPLFAPEVERGQWSPPIEIFERDGKLVVCAELPGLDKKDVKIELNDNILTIEGERKSEQRDEKGGWSERSYGRFLRTIALPEGVGSDKANATFNNGVLEITLDAPQRNQRKGRQIEIK